MPCSQPSEASCRPAPSQWIFALLTSAAETERWYLLVRPAAAATTNACVVLKSHLIHSLHPSGSVFHPVPPCASFPLRSTCEAKLARCITQPQITPGIRALLIPLLIPALYNRGSLQIWFFLRAGNGSCWEGRAFRRVWAAIRRLQLPRLDPEVGSGDPPSGATSCAGTGNLWATRDALRPAQHRQRSRD